MATKSIREPAVAGMFYQATKEALRRQIEWCFKHDVGPGILPPAPPGDGPRVLGLVSPHAGYMYSGPVAAHSFAALANGPRPDTVIIIGPNHRALGADIAIGGCDAWITPLGETLLDHDVADGIIKTLPRARIDDAAHALEHSIEVQVPFLQFVLGHSFRLVPIVTLAQDAYTSAALGQAIAVAIRGRKALVIASTDMTHYEMSTIATRKDARAIDHIVTLDAEGLLRTVYSDGITMCGPGSVAATIIASIKTGASGGQVLRYATSAEVAGQSGPAVGYASIAIT